MLSLCIFFPSFARRAQLKPFLFANEIKNTQEAPNTRQCLFLAGEGHQCEKVSSDPGYLPVATCISARCLGLLPDAEHQGNVGTSRGVTVVAPLSRQEQGYGAIRKLRQRGKEKNGTEARLVPKKDCNYRDINSFWKARVSNSFTYFCSFY